MIDCVVGSQNPVKINAARHALEQTLNETVTISPRSVPSGVADQPMSEKETRQGAINRVQACLDNASEHERATHWFIAIEGGVDEFSDGPATFAYVAIYHNGFWAVNRSANLPLPGIIYDALQAGRELGDVMDEVFDTDNIKQKGGAISLLTNNLATRQSVYELALILGLAKFNYPELYGGI